MSLCTKYLIITRGLPGCGKSTFCKNNFKKEEIISPDEIRIKINGFCKINNELRISQENPDGIWNIVFKNLHISLKNNKYTILDATSLRNSYLKRYFKLSKLYSAKLIIVDFSDVSLDICKQRNKVRLPEYTRVSDEILEKMNFDLNKEINADFKKFIINHKDFVKDLLP